MFEIIFICLGVFVVYMMALSSNDMKAQELERLAQKERLKSLDGRKFPSEEEQVEENRE